MERLTKSSNSGMVWYQSDLLLLEPCELSYSQVGKVLRRLGAYEDTGLAPEEIKAIIGTTEQREKELGDLKLNLRSFGTDNMTATVRVPGTAIAELLKRLAQNDGYDLVVDAEL